MDKRAHDLAPEARTTMGASLGFHLGLAHRAVKDGWEARLAGLGVSAPQAAVLRALWQGPGCGVRELARRTGTDAMNAKRLVDLLEGSGLVRSVPDGGHRQRRSLEPTPPGAALAGEVARRAASWERDLVARLGHGRAAQLHGLLDQVVAAADIDRAR